MSKEKSQWQLDEDLQIVEGKISMILESSLDKIRYPVDCVAFDSASSSVREGGHHHSICRHPDRGEQFGCLLTKEDSVGKITRLRESKCIYKVKKGRRGSANLRNRINQEAEDKIW